MYETFLASVPILASLEPYERAKIADALESRTFAPGEDIIKEGEPGDEFFLIENGSAVVEKSGSGVIGNLNKGDYFGGESQFFFTYHDVWLSVPFDRPPRTCSS